MSPEVRAAIEKAFDASLLKPVERFRSDLRASEERHSAELAALRAELAEAREQIAAKGVFNPADWWHGPWREGDTIERGYFAQDKGHAWLCLKTTRGRPGECADFSMFTKGGKNGRDAPSVREHRSNGRAPDERARG